MLNAFKPIAEIDDRYASEDELLALEEISHSLEERLQLYEKLARAEERILTELYRRVTAADPDLFILNGRDISPQCKRDVRYTFHHAVQSMLLGETWLQEDLIIWFQTIIRSFKIQPRCELVYSTLETLLRSSLSPRESQLICPIIRKIKESLTQP